jgi:predicted ATPase
VTRLLRAAAGVESLDPATARAQIRAQSPGAVPEDLLLFDDLLGIADPDVELPKIDPDARRRRLSILVNAATRARQSPAVFVVEDTHWIDEVSESLLADFFAVMRQTPTLVLITYRPEYRGALTQLAGAQTVSLAPLSDSETAVLVSELLGPDPSNDALGLRIAKGAAGNPFFAEEIVREMAERGVLRGEPGAYVSAAEVGDISVPETLQATIAARIDRLDATAKHTLSAAAVLGAQFDLELLSALGVDAVVDDLIAAQLIDQVRFTRPSEYVFHHPSIRAVAYDLQLESDRAELHRRVAAAIESRNPVARHENAALIAEHLEAAGDGRDAYGWQMRAATWATNRDIAAAWRSWERARTIADALPADDPDRAAMRIAPRTMLCGIAWRVHEHATSTRFEELRGAGDGSLASGPAARGVAARIGSDGPHRVTRRSELDGGLGPRVDLRKGEVRRVARRAAVVTDGDRPGRR